MALLKLYDPKCITSSEMTSEAVSYISSYLAMSTANNGSALCHDSAMGYTYETRAHNFIHENEPDKRFFGYSSFRSFRAIELFEGSIKDCIWALRKNKFQFETIVHFSRTTKLKRDECVAFHLDIDDTKWIEVIISLRRNREFYRLDDHSAWVVFCKNDNEELLEAISLGTRSFYIERVSTENRLEIHIIKEAICCKYKLIASKNLLLDFLRYYLQYRQKNIEEYCKKLKKLSNTTSIIKDDECIKTIYDLYLLQWDIPKNQKMYVKNTDLTEQKIIEAEKQLIEKENRKYPDKDEIESIVRRGERGFYFNEVFLCKLCRCKHSSGYSYLIRGHIIRICKYCYADNKQLKPYKKLIYTNMGNGKKR